MAAVMVACRPMRIDNHAIVVSTVAVSWLAATTALGSALILAVVGQGVGAMTGGCGWVGATIPLNRQVWALVNQPTLNFSSQPGASGYWLGSLVLPLFAALLLLTLRPRRPTLVGQLMVVQMVWWAALVAGAWLPLLDAVDGHLSRWLLLNRLPAMLVWSAPVAAAVVAVFATFRLLEIARSGRPNLGRGTRVATLVVHLILPVLGWIGAVFLVGGSLPLAPVVALAVPVAAALVFGWLRFPPPYPRHLQRPSRRAFGVLLAGAVLAAIAIWMAGRPLTDGRAPGVLWGEPESFNNIRPWIEFPSSATEIRHQD